MFTKWLLLAGSLLVVASPAYFAYQAIEWLGVGILGLMIACLAMRVELESEGPVGHPQSTGVYAAIQQRRDSMSASERAEMWADTAVNVRGARFAQGIGATLIVLGAAGFFLS